jgi:hypothetical protein
MKNAFENHGNAKQGANRFPEAAAGEMSGDFWRFVPLEHCFFRHVQGLVLARRLLEAAESGRFGRGLIVCDSWAWAYLQHAWPSTRCEALTLQAFDGSVLKCLFPRLTASTGSRTVCYRNAKSGEAILTVPSDEMEVSAQLVQLAAYCRGNVGLALDYWRSRLRTEPEVDTSQPEARRQMEEKRQGGEQVVWVASELSEPTLPPERDDSPLMMLHVLLIHGGLPESVLPEVLPFSHARCMSALLALRSAGALQCNQGRWCVRVLAYAAVCEKLGGATTWWTISEAARWKTSPELHKSSSRSTPAR